MTKKQLFLKILKHLNKTFCDNKIKVKIVFKKRMVSYKKRKDKGTTLGYYEVRDKTIAILEDASIIDQLDTLIHEFTHTYQHQVLGQKLSHNKHSGAIFWKFKKEADKILKFSIK